MTERVEVVRIVTAVEVTPVREGTAGTIVLAIIFSFYLSTSNFVQVQNGEGIGPNDLSTIHIKTLHALAEAVL
jgi:hypothetical protein